MSTYLSQSNKNIEYFVYFLFSYFVPLVPSLLLWVTLGVVKIGEAYVDGAFYQFSISFSLVIATTTLTNMLGSSPKTNKNLVRDSLRLSIVVIFLSSTATMSVLIAMEDEIKLQTENIFRLFSYTNLFGVCFLIILYLVDVCKAVDRFNYKRCKE